MTECPGYIAAFIHRGASALAALSEAAGARHRPISIIFTRMTLLGAREYIRNLTQVGGI